MNLNLLALLFFGVCWGSSIPLLKLAVSAGHHPLGMIIWQLAVSVIVLGPVVWYRSLPIAFNWRTLQYLMIISLLGSLIPNSFSLIAINQLPGGIMSIVLATVPIISLLIALTFNVEKFIWTRLVGVALGVSSLLLIALPDTTLPDPSKAPWILVAIIAPVCYAIEGNFVAVKALRSLSPLSTLFGASFVGLVLLTPIVYANGWQVSVWSTWDVSRMAMVFAGIAHMVAYTGYLWLLARAGAVYSSQVAYVVTLTGILSSVVFLGERYGWLVWLAVILMMIAITLVRPVNTVVNDLNKA